MPNLDKHRLGLALDFFEQYFPRAHVRNVTGSCPTGKSGAPRHSPHENHISLLVMLKDSQPAISETQIGCPRTQSLPNEHAGSIQMRWSLRPIQPAIPTGERPDHTPGQPPAPPDR
jgi:hypothetical protein